MRSMRFLTRRRVSTSTASSTLPTAWSSNAIGRFSFEYGEGDERWILLDTDHVTQGTHLPGFLGALHIAATQGVNVALSMPCFELWLLLHHELETAVPTLGNAREVEVALRTRLGEYNKTNLVLQKTND
jgi:hypothetical protein